MGGKISDLFYMSRDFLRIVRGKDYFHEPARLGRHFRDERCYYYDFSMKADWMGDMKDGVPLLFVPTWGRSAHFPIMILQYGLGLVDCYFEKGDPSLLGPIENVARWMEKAVLPEGHFDNLFPEISPRHEYFSANSCLAQGHALSFLSRVLRYDLVSVELRSMVETLLGRVYSNMILPLAEGGTSLMQGNGIAFCETCRKDEHVVLNGWIYALFGLLDFRKADSGSAVESILSRSFTSLARSLPDYFMPGGWSLYDNKGRVSSPVYHTSHVVLLEALWLLTRIPEFEAAWRRFREGDGWTNRIRFTLRKIADKITDRQAYLTH